MAYSDLNGIHVPATNVSAPASWGLQVRDNFEALYRPPAVRVRRTTGQTIPNNSFTLVTWESKAYELGVPAGAMWGSGARITAPIAGIYAFTYTGRWNTTAPNTGARSAFCKFSVGAVYFDADDRGAAGGSNVTSNKLACELSMAAGDFVEVEAYQTNGADLLLGNAGPCFATLRWLRPNT